MQQITITQQLSTIRDYIRWASSEFNRKKLTYGHGMGSALDEAAYLVLYALELPYDWPESYFDCTLTVQEREQVIKVVSSRVETRQPAAYITNEAWFCGLSFYVDSRVLVPRSPIAELVSSQFEPWLDPYSVHNILDLCTGSGCIAISCQYAFAEANVYASDLSADALDVARINLERYELSEDIQLFQSDLFDNIPKKKFDLIVSNPPYVDAEDMSALTDEFKAEPELGLAAGEDGLSIVDRMLLEAKSYLSNSGLLVVEVGNSQKAMIEKYPQLPMSWIEFENGGSGVFCITAEELKKHTLN